jgi:hypothetical protein
MTNLPTPIDREGRFAFSIAFFATEDDANTYAAFIRERGDTYYGGYFDGMPCGRDAGRDRRDADGNVTAYAVTTA